MNVLTKQEVLERLSAMFSPDELLAMDAQIDAHIAAENARRSAAEAADLNIANVVPTLRSWSKDAETAVAAWDGWTTEQRFAAFKVTLDRLGVFFDRFADLLVALGKSQD